LPDAPSDRHPKTGALDAAFDAMLLNTTNVADDNFIDDWGAIDTEEALALSALMTLGLKTASSTHRLPFGACQQCTRGSSRHVFVFSIRTVLIPLLFSIGRVGGRHTSYELLV
jgi:hypothetical protein